MIQARRKFAPTVHWTINTKLSQRRNKQELVTNCPKFWDGITAKIPGNHPTNPTNKHATNAENCIIYNTLPKLILSRSRFPLL